MFKIIKNINLRYEYVAYLTAFQLSYEMLIWEEKYRVGPIIGDIYKSQS